MIGLAILLCSIGAAGYIISVIAIGVYYELHERAGVYNMINFFCNAILIIGIIIGCMKSHTVRCPKCDEKNSWTSVDIDEKYCSTCGTKYIVKHEED